ncbi:AlkZ family DNA glycosylase [Brachybacterium sp. MASK1Z-5]|uniref:AlkZ family DNA glycosylase n=1 Tax=Brachybacterium halotolerans TaxID=2795215 RepID=A0ABS1B5T8_9MICO|nr:winged helix DNA-binding domain-containing protein [Brachybacterium halotolerans]MBK0329984.1 AlkZ family DNA glycosylase [Brachybacterium halotolerans]
MITTAQLLALRLRSHGLMARGPRLSVHDVASRMLAVQAQDLAQGTWAFGIRARGSALGDVHRALERGELIRASSLRGTLHFLAARDLRWMLGITAPREIAAAGPRLRRFELDDPALCRARSVTEALLGDRTALPRAEYLRGLEAAGIPTGGQRGYHLIWWLSQSGIVCGGPARGTGQGLVLTEEWIGDSVELAGDDALRELAGRYLAGHGPATDSDLAWWAGMPLSQARTAIRLARADLIELQHRGVTHWATARTMDEASDHGVRRLRIPKTTHALPGYDEYLLGYRDRSAAIPEEYVDRVTTGRNGIFHPTVLARGRVIATWRRSDSAGRTTATIEPFRELTAPDSLAFARSAAAFERFHSGI